MMWPLKKKTCKTNEEIEVKQARAELARDKMDMLHKSLDVAVQKLIAEQKQSEAVK